MKKLLALVLALVMVMSMATVASAGSALTEFHTYETTNREMETFNILYSQSAQDLQVLANCVDGLLTNNNHGTLSANIAKSWSSEDGGQTWTFQLRDDVTWVDYQGNVMANCVASDWLYGLEWVLNYHKNDAANTSMPMEMIVGAADYYEYTKGLSEEEGKALGIDKLTEMVGIEAPDDYTLVYHCTAALPYFPTVACYNCLYPLSGAYLAQTTVDAYKAVTYDTMWYNGPYTITYYIQNNEKVLTRNQNYFNKDVTLFDNVNIKMVESADVAFQLFQTGELDYVALTQSNLMTIYENASNEFHDYIVEARPTKYSYQIHLVYDKNKEDGSDDTAWNAAVANEAFRQSWYYGLDLTNFLARTNSISPLSCENYAYTANNLVTMEDGRDYTSRVTELMGITPNGETYARLDTDKAAAYKAQAMEELTAAGVSFPIEVDYYISASSQTALDSANVLKEIFADCLGTDYIDFQIKTYVSSLAKEVRDPQLASFYINGWGADFGDPVNFLGQETYGDDNAYYSTHYSMVNNATDATLIATFEEFSAMVDTAKAINDDLYARYEAFAQAEAYMLSHALAIPCYYNVTWELTTVNDYSKIYAVYGNQSDRFVNWETNSDIYTTAEYAELAAAYAGK